MLRQVEQTPWALSVDAGPLLARCLKHSMTFLIGNRQTPSGVSFLETFDPQMSVGFMSGQCSLTTSRPGLVDPTVYPVRHMRMKAESG